ncbi:MAG: Lon family ATP-dependent protease [Clostridiales bacterium]
MVKQIDEDKEIREKLGSLESILNDVFGADQMIIRSTKLEILNLINSENIEDRILALEKIVYYDSGYPGGEGSLSLRIDNLMVEMAEVIAKRSLEDKLDKIIAEKMQERQEEYYREIKMQVLKEQGGPENPGTLKKYAELECLEEKKLTRSAMDILRPQTLEEIVGQDKAVNALLGKLASPYPQHVIVYGPPGVGKTSAARLALEAAKAVKSSPFAEDAPFVEIDGSTLRWDPRETTNPLLGSVHDPIYQGAKRDLAETGIPEPKPGLVTQANGGVLFIDEIGEMDPMLLIKLLKVLEDKRVEFESSYYDPLDDQVPKYIKKIFDEGLPADFILIAATTRDCGDLNSALRSRCGEVYFEPLSPKDIKGILVNAAEKLKIKLEDNAADLIADSTADGRKAVNILSDAYGLLMYEQKDRKTKRLVIKKKKVEEVLQNARLSPNKRDKSQETKEIGKIFGLGVYGFLGSVLEIEAVAFPCAEQGKGVVRFNDTAGSMAKDSVFNAASVFRLLGEDDLQNYDAHVNVVGGGNIDGPSAGLGIFLSLYSAVREKPIPQNIAITGELSVRGNVCPVGGIAEKIYGAKQAGVKKVILPYDNLADVPQGIKGIKIVPVKTVTEAMDEVFNLKK